MNRTLFIALIGIFAGAIAFADDEVGKAAAPAANVNDFVRLEDLTGDQLALYFDTLKVAELKLKEAQAAFDEAKAMFDGGAATKQQVALAEANLAEAKKNLELVRKELKAVQRYQSLSQKISIDFSNAKIGSVAAALSKLGNFGIIVDKSVSPSLTVTTKATNMPLGSVLEYVANSAKLALTLAPDGKLAFIKPAQMTINGRTVDVMGTAWPWTQDVLVAPLEPGFPIGEKWKGLWGQAPVPDMVKGWQDFQTVPAPAFQFMQPSGPITITPLGSTMILISEPGSGTKGEPGYWLTLYMIKNGKLLPSSKLFHSSARPPAMIDMTKWSFGGAPTKVIDSLPAKAAVGGAPTKPEKTSGTAKPK